MREINIYGTIFSGTSTTDFREILEVSPDSKLFIYNENFDQYNDKDDISSGGGNGFLRSYRIDNEINQSLSQPKVQSLGIPTACYNGNESMDIVKESINLIYNYINSNDNITDIYYSADNNMGLGLGIFANMPFAKANIDEISTILKEMFIQLSQNHSIKLYKLSSAGIEEQQLL